MQLFIASVESQGPARERNCLTVSDEYPLTFHDEEHEIRRTVAMWGQPLSRREPDDPYIRLQAIEEWLCYDVRAVVSGSVTHADHVHDGSIAQPRPSAALPPRFDLRASFERQERRCDRVKASCGSGPSRQGSTRKYFGSGPWCALPPAPVVPNLAVVELRAHRVSGPSCDG